MSLKRKRFDIQTISRHDIETIKVNTTNHPKNIPKDSFKKMLPAMAGLLA